MTRVEAWFSHASALLVGGTGLVYGWMRYVAEPALDELEFALVNHPWQPALQAWHIVLAPLLVFVGGILWRDHVWRRVAAGFPARRRTGLALFALFVPMVASGYLLQVAADERWRLIWIWAHALSSSGWLLVYGLHQLTPRGELDQRR